MSVLYELMMHSETVMMMSWQGDAFQITGLCGFLLLKASNADLLAFVCQTEQAIEQISDVLHHW